MKSAWMLTAVTGLVLVAGVSGCIQPQLGISLPAGSAARPVVAQAPASKPAAATANPPVASAPADGDPMVAQLTQKIEALASRPPAEPAAVPPTTQPVAVAPATLTPAPFTQAPAPAALPPTTAPAPTLAQAAPIAPVASASAASVNPMPSPAPIATVATQPASAEPPVANTPISVGEDSQKTTAVSAEVVASPTPRSMPIIQPSAATPPPAPAASPVAKVQITNIRPVIAPASADPNGTLATANQPAHTTQPAPAASLESVVTQMEQTLQQRPPHPEDELRLRLLYLAAGMDTKVTEPVKGMDPVQTEFLNAIIKAVASSRQAMLEPSNASPSALAATDELRRLLGQQSGVSIPRIALVTKVSSYGDYEAITPLRFKAGTEITAYVYTEVANFRSEPVEGDRLRTLLGERVQVFDSAGKVIWERHENNIEDRVRSPRRDFFVPFPMKLPATLAPGEYVVKVTIEDRIGNTTDQQRLSFSIQ